MNTPKLRCHIISDYTDTMFAKSTNMLTQMVMFYFSKRKKPVLYIVQWTLKNRPHSQRLLGSTIFANIFARSED